MTLWITLLLTFFKKTGSLNKYAIDMSLTHSDNFRWTKKAMKTFTLVLTIIARPCWFRGEYKRR